MIGDYLKLGTLPFRVAQVTTPTVAGDLWDGFILENGVEDEGEPIPLTPKIMEALGFEHTHHLDHANECHIYSWASEKNKTHIMSAVFFRNITDLRVFGTGSHFFLSRGTIYLHELQHAIKNCDIDFRVELEYNDIR